MKIKSIKTDSFGRFVEPKLNVEFRSGINVVVGKNEAGKSTLRRALRELIYGFQTTKIEKHPYKPGNGSALNLQGEIELENGNVVGVQRELTKNSSGQEIYNGHLVEIGNDPIREVDQIPMMLFKGLFEMDLSDLVKLDASKWSEVENQIALQYGLDNLLSPQSLMLDLEKQMHTIWRPHKRGKFILKEIDDMLIALGEKRNKLKKKRHAFQDQLVRKSELTLELHELEDQIKHLKKWIRKTEGQIPAWRKFSEIKSIEKELGAIEKPSFTAEEFLQISKENESLREDKSELDDALAKARRNMKPLSPIESAVSADPEVAMQIEKLYQAYKLAKQNQVELKLEIKRFEALLSKKSSELTQDQWNAALFKMWKDLAIRDLDRALKRRKHMQPKAKLPLGILMSGAILAGASFVLEYMPLVIAGGISVLLGIGLLVKSSLNKTFEFGGILFHDDVWIHRHHLLNAIEALRSEIDEQTIRIETMERHEKVLKAHEKTIYDQLGQFNLQNGQSLDESVEKLSFHLQNLNVKIRDNDALDKEKALLNSKNRKAGHALLMNQQAYNSMRSALLKLGDTVEGGIDQLKRLTALESRYRELLAKFEKIDIEASLMDDFSYTLDLEVDLSQAQVKYDHLRERRESANIELVSLKKDEALLFEDEKLEAVETQIEKLNLDRENAMASYNQLKMIHTLMAYADDSFRKKYQPAIIKRASELLSSFTEGKYSAISTDGQGHMLVKNTKIGQFISVHESLSRGTLEQIYMSMRLSLAEALDQEALKMPLILDEVFVNWDKERLGCALKTIKEISRSRQIIYLTCHDWMAEKLTEEYGGYFIELK